MRNYTFTILDNNEIKIYIEEQEGPVLEQPTYPNGVPFESKAKATAWAKAFIAAALDDSKDFPADGPGLPTKPQVKPVPAPVEEDPNATNA